MATQHVHACNIAKLLRDRVKNGEPPVSGYGVVAEMLGLNGHDYAKTIGQACSRIDAASFVSGWPMLALHMVRKPSGRTNSYSFSMDWHAWNDETLSALLSHPWTVAQVDDVISALNGLPPAGARALWAGYLKRETQQPGFIRKTLHRKLIQ